MFKWNAAKISEDVTYEDNGNEEKPCELQSN